MRHLRVDDEVWQEWRELATAFRSKSMNDKEIREKCSERGISYGSLSSPPNILWELYSFDVALQLLVDEFHNLAEGHGNILLEFFLALTPKAEEVVEAAWNDPNIWDPLKSGNKCMLV